MLFLIQKHYSEVSIKFRKFQRPVDFEPKMSRVKRELDSIGERIHLLEVRTENYETLQGKHDQCMVCTTKHCKKNTTCVF